MHGLLQSKNYYSYVHRRVMAASAFPAGKGIFQQDSDSCQTARFGSCVGNEPRNVAPLSNDDDETYDDFLIRFPYQIPDLPHHAIEKSLSFNRFIVHKSFFTAGRH
ncbi:hypothetical protein TNCV_4901711 [Trichonephila clavipes]|nr:hypothetical protein TNCV_4901711 [Trichonephila clavipes]